MSIYINKQASIQKFPKHQSFNIQISRHTPMQKLSKHQSLYREIELDQIILFQQ